MVTVPKQEPVASTPQILDPKNVYKQQTHNFKQYWANDTNSGFELRPTFVFPTVTEIKGDLLQMLFYILVESRYRLKFPKIRVP